MLEYSSAKLGTTKVTRNTIRTLDSATRTAGYNSETSSFLRTESDIFW